VEAYKTHATRVFNRLGHVLPKLQILAPNPFKSTYANFYIIPKVHKTPIGGRPITSAFSTLTSKVPKVASNILKLLFTEFKIHAIKMVLILHLPYASTQRMPFKRHNRPLIFSQK
jgi:hypothetical protein